MRLISLIQSPKNHADAADRGVCFIISPYSSNAINLTGKILNASQGLGNDCVLPVALLRSE